jgi:DNA-binding ferritin-like protein
MVDGRMEVYQKRTEDKVDTARSGIQGMMEAAINSIQSELEETIKNLVENILASVDQRTQDLCEELNVKTEESQLGLQAMTMSLNMLTKSLCEEVVNQKKGLSRRV